MRTGYIRNWCLAHVFYLLFIVKNVWNFELVSFFSVFVVVALVVSWWTDKMPRQKKPKKTRTNCVLQFPMEIVAFYYLFIYIDTATLSQQRLLWRSHRDSVFVQRCQQQYTQSASLQLGPFPTSVASIHATRQRRLLQNQRRTRLRSRSSNWRQHGTHRFLPAGTWRWRRRITLRRFASCPLVAFISFSTHNGTHLTRWDKQEYQTFLSHLIIIIIIFIDNCR